MRLTSDYTLVLEVFSPTGKELLHTFAPSLARCAEDTWFSGICTGQLPPSCTAASTTMRPLWRQEGSNAPGVHGFVIDIDCQCTGCQHTFAKWYGLKSLRLQIQAAVQPLLHDKALTFEALRYRLDACRTPAAPVTLARLHAEAEATPLPIVPRSLATLLQESPNLEAMPSAVFPILVSTRTVRDITAETLRSIGTEQAGMLVGQLYYDAARRQVFLHVAAQVLAETPGERHAAAFHFHPDTFLTAQYQLDQRGQGDIIVGWWHSHAWCRACLDTPACQVSTLFFSPEDFHVHNAAFAQPYMVAMVAGKAAHKPMRTPGVEMFGWQDGTVVPRPFHGVTLGH
jgi:hypothetical protein